MLAKRVIPAVRIAGRWYVPRDVLSQWLTMLLTDGNDGKVTDRKGVTEGSGLDAIGAVPAGSQGGANLTGTRSQPQSGTFLHTNEQNAKK